MLVLGFYESLTFAVLDALHRPASFFGVMMSVQAVGSILGGVVVARLIHRLGEARVLGIGLIAWVVASLIYTIASLPVAGAALFIFGIAVTLHAVARGTADPTPHAAPPHRTNRAGVSTLTKGAQTLSIGIGVALVDHIDYRILLLVIAVTVAAAAVPLLRDTNTTPNERPSFGVETGRPLGEAGVPSLRPPGGGRRRGDRGWRD